MQKPNQGENMNKYIVAVLTMTACSAGVGAYASPGEYWEITSKMEMPGMPFAMPPTTQKVCIPKGGQNDPGKTSGDKDCKMTDTRTVGNKITWKARCDRNGEVMTGIGEQTTTANDYHGKLVLSGKSSGQDMNMTMVYSGKRIGGSCDSEEQTRQAKAKVDRTIAQMCDTSNYQSTADWIGAADLVLRPGATCASQRKQFCDAVLRDARRDAKTYNALLMHDRQMQTGISIAKECGLNMAVTTKAVCKTLNDENYNDLSAHCPAEAKKFREVQRRKDCEGRAYTSQVDFKACMSGKSSSHGGRSYTSDESEGSSSKSALDNPAGAAIEGAKKLKGMFGF
jgi:hypothetical protein